MSATSSTSAAASSLNTHAQSFLIQKNDSIEKVDEKINGAIILCMRTLSEDYQKKLNDIDKAADQKAIYSLLKKGPWYSVDLQAKQTKCVKKIFKDFFEGLRKKHYLMNGFMNPNNFTLNASENTTTDDNLKPELKRYFFQLRENRDAYDHVMNATKSFSIIECGVAVKIAYYQGLALALGKERFNAVFSDKGFGRPNFLSIIHHDVEPLTFLMDGPPRGMQPPKLGERAYFRGHPNYTKKHICGHEQGFHAIFTSIKDGVERFTAFGLPADLTELEIRTYLLRAYNEPPQLLYRQLPSDEQQLQNNDLLDLNYLFEKNKVDPNIKNIPGRADLVSFKINAEPLSLIANAPNESEIHSISNFWISQMKKHIIKEI